MSFLESDIVTQRVPIRARSAGGSDRYFSLIGKDNMNPSFCLHLSSMASPAGMVCATCGAVVTAINETTEQSQRTSVGLLAPPLEVEKNALSEWKIHIKNMHDQAAEVMQRAERLFCAVYNRRGAVTGNRARALCLVCFLYEMRRLNSANPSNESVLIKRLAVPPKLMHWKEHIRSFQLLSKAFTSLASVCGSVDHPDITVEVEATHPNRACRSCLGDRCFLSSDCG